MCWDGHVSVYVSVCLDVAAWVPSCGISVYVYGGWCVNTCLWLHGSDVKQCADVHDDVRRRLNVYVCMYVYMCVHHGVCVYVFV